MKSTLWKVLGGAGPLPASVVPVLSSPPPGPEEEAPQAEEGGSGPIVSQVRDAFAQLLHENPTELPAMPDVLSLVLVHRAARETSLEEPIEDAWKMHVDLLSDQLLEAYEHLCEEGEEVPSLHDVMKFINSGVASTPRPQSPSSDPDGVQRRRKAKEKPREEKRRSGTHKEKKRGR